MGYAVRSAQHNAGMVQLGTHARLSSNSLVGTYMHAPIRKFLAPSGLGVE